MTQIKDGGPAKVEIEFNDASVLPCNAAGTMVCALLLSENEEGNLFCFAAYYLNQYPLECENWGGECNEDGCVEFTGWFYDESNFEYDNCYHQVESKPIAWALVPSAATVSSALAASPLVPQEEPETVDSKNSGENA